MTALLSLSGGEVAKPRFAQFFHGSLASLTIRPGKMESQKVIACLQACKEGLDISSLESLGQGIKVRKELLRGQRLPRGCALGKWGLCRVAQRWCRGKGAGPVGRFVTVTSLGDLRCVPNFLDGALAYHQLTAQEQAGSLSTRGEWLCFSRSCLGWWLYCLFAKGTEAACGNIFRKYLKIE